MFGSEIIIVVISLLIAVTIHEWAHAYTAYLLGDPTAKNEGRLTLNPLAHLDLMGTIALIFVHFGWGKPVPVNPNNLKNPKKDTLLISLAGPISNLTVALFFALPFKFFLQDINGFFPILVESIIFLNLVLAVFNLLPIYPLDGSEIVIAFTPARYGLILNKFIDYGPLFLFGIIIIEHTTDLPILWNFLSPIVNFLWLAINLTT